MNELRNKKALPPPGAANCTLEVTEETSIAACRRLAAENEDDGAVVVCLNFASAKNVCGGMVRGSLAQEESLGRSTTFQEQNPLNEFSCRRNRC